jgi:hypothetical protein|tara:strand:- start:95 stop:247 length:153 start_codon:yes stop_codon:yes gene_type:complete
LEEAGDPRLLVLRSLMIPEGFWPDGPTGPPMDGDRGRVSREALDYLAGRT